MDGGSDIVWAIATESGRSHVGQSKTRPTEDTVGQPYATESQKSVGRTGYSVAYKSSELALGDRLIPEPDPVVGLTLLYHSLALFTSPLLQ